MSEQARKKAAAQSDLDAILAQKVSLQGQLSTLKSTYDSELLALSEIQGSLVREKQKLEASTTEMNSLQQAMSSLKAEKQRVSEELESITKQNADAKNMIREFTEIGTAMQLELQRVQQEIQQQSKYLEMNQKLANDASQDARNVTLELNGAKAQLQSIKESSGQPAFPAAPIPVTSSVAPSETLGDDLGDDPFAQFRQEPVTTKSAPPPLPQSRPPVKAMTEAPLKDLQSPAGSSISASPSFHSFHKTASPAVDKANAVDEIDALLSANKPKKGKGANFTEPGRPSGSMSDIGSPEFFTPQFQGPRGPPSVRSLDVGHKAARSPSEEALNKGNNRPMSVRSFQAGDELKTSGLVAGGRFEAIVPEESPDFPTFPATIEPSVAPVSEGASANFNKGLYNIDAEAEFKNAFNLDTLSPATGVPPKISAAIDDDLESAFDFKPSVTFRPSVTAAVAPVSRPANAVPDFSASFKATQLPSFSSAPLASAAGKNLMSDEDLNNAFAVGSADSSAEVPPASIQSLLELGFTRGMHF